MTQTYWEVRDRRTGALICHCGDESDALRMVQMAPERREHRQHRRILDQVITVQATTDKALGGQQGLPPATHQIETTTDRTLPERQAVPL